MKNGRGRAPRAGSGHEIVVALLTLAVVACASGPGVREAEPSSVQLGPRPYALLDALTPGPLRDRLDACREGPFRASAFSIGHRGAPLQFPEHTRESYVAAARMGAGVLECDVTFTKDHVLVCRHSQCDLATTTNILATPLAERCEPFVPARIDPDSGRPTAIAQRRCCTSELTLAEFRTLEGRLDAWNPLATREEDFLTSTAAYRGALYDTGGTLMTHAESIALFRDLGVAMTPELKAPEVEMPHHGLTRSAYATALIEEYVAAGIDPEDVFPQSFDRDVVRVWIRAHPEFGNNAVSALDRPLGEIDDAELAGLRGEGFRTLAPPIGQLLRLDDEGRIVATDGARRARAAGFELVTWTIERSGRIRDGRVEGRRRDFYLGPLLPALENDGDVFRVIHALREEAEVRAIFSDWPATVTYYANCMGID